MENKGNSNIGKLNTAYPLTFATSSAEYISDFNGVRYSIGNLTLLVVKFTMAKNVNAYLTLAGGSVAPMYGGFPKIPTYENLADSVSPAGCLLVQNNGTLRLVGSHTAEKTYYAVGAYVSANAY